MRSFAVPTAVTVVAAVVAVVKCHVVLWCAQHRDRVSVCSEYFTADLNVRVSAGGTGGVAMFLSGEKQHVRLCACAPSSLNCLRRHAVSRSIGFRAHPRRTYQVGMRIHVLGKHGIDFYSGATIFHRLRTNLRTRATQGRI